VSAPVVSLVALGGALGSLARYGLTLSLPGATSGWPWATVAANVTGALLLGVLAARAPRSPLLTPFLGTGVLGGYTTFSAFSLDARTLLADGRPLLAATYVAVTLSAGLIAVAVGLLAGRPAST